MSGIYIHIPFCKQACHYCDFHFSTSLKNKELMIQALIREIEMRKQESTDEIETIYFGGGTPSLLSTDEINTILSSISQHYKVIEQPEITLEANPDDLTKENLKAIAEQTTINRLSVGIQSFFDEDLKMMNRAHNASEAKESLRSAVQLFDNITIDLIYGIPGMSNQRWKENIQYAIELGIPHVSSYALTVEPKTALDSFIKKGLIENPDDNQAHEQFHILIEELEKNGFLHYELSNFAKPSYFSKNNSAYWLGKKYIGIGPSAHSFNGESRSWNIANNTKFIQSINAGILPSQVEILTTQDRYNEYVMTGLRTMWGVSKNTIEENFGKTYLDYLIQQASKHVLDGSLQWNNDILITTRKGKFFCDGIASDLFLLNLK